MTVIVDLRQRVTMRACRYTFRLCMNNLIFLQNGMLLYVNVFICDLQALSKRIHYGKFVAESKFRASPADYEAAIKKSVRPQ